MGDDLRSSDVEAVDLPSDTSLRDFSSGSDEYYVPDYEDLDTSDREPGNLASGSDESEDDDLLHVPRPNPRPKKGRKRLNWVRVYPPEPEKDIAPNFMPRNTGPRMSS